MPDTATWIDRPRPTRKVSPEALRALMERLLDAVGCAPDIAAVAAGVHLEADLRGHHIQGLDHMSELIANIRAGRIDPTGRPELVAEGPAWAQIDGNRGLGHPAGILAAETVIAKAGTSGCAVVGVRESADIFIVGFYGEMIARAGYAALITTNVPPHVHAHGGAEAVLGTNPLVIAVPSDGPDPIILDMATSIVAASRVRQAAYDGTVLPDGIGVDADGVASTDAAAVELGSIGPMAGHRGFGLALCLGLLSGPLVGAATGRALGAWLDRDVPDRGLGHFFLAVDPAIFGPVDAFRAATGAHLQDIRDSRRAPGVDAIRIPGERAFARRAQSLAEGIDMPEIVWSTATRLATDLGVDMEG
jgi:ureidoglycolate dehydrogenase (NAD+)